MTATVIVADDSEFIRETIAGAVRSLGDVAVLLARNGKEALELVTAHPEAGLVVLDLNMPILDGQEFLRRLQRGADGRPQVFVLGNRSDQHRLNDCRGLGANEVVTKPLDVEALCHLILPQLNSQEAAR